MQGRAREKGSGDEEEDGSYCVGLVGQEEESHLRVAGVSCVEGGDSVESAEDDMRPEDDAGDEQRRTVRREPSRGR